MSRKILIIGIIVVLVLIICFILLAVLSKNQNGNSGTKNILPEFIQKMMKGKNPNGSASSPTRTGAGANDNNTNIPGSVSATFNSNVQDSVLPKDSGKPSIMLSPSGGIVKVGSLFVIQILANSQDQKVQGIDIFSLNYDPTVLEAQDSGTASGVQIQYGSIFSQYLGNSVNTTKGKIMISGLVGTGSKGEAVNGVLATVKFKTLKTGQTKISLDFQPGQTTDTNMTMLDAKGMPQDILQSVGEMNLVIN